MPGAPEVLTIEAAGVPLAVRRWSADAPRSIAVVVHGLGEHAGRYEEVARALAASGVSVVAADLRGHGASGGRRGHVREFDQFLVDLDRVFSEATQAAPALPRFLIGHSLGGLIALRWAQTRPEIRIAGLVLSAPFLGFAEPPPSWLDLLARALAPTLPALAFPNRIEPAALSRDGAEVAAYEADPLVHDRITPRLYVEVTRAMVDARRDTDRVTVPRVLFIVPGADRIADPGATLEIASVLAHRVAVEVHPYSGWRHEAFHEIDRSRAIEDVTRWISQVPS